MTEQPHNGVTAATDEDLANLRRFLATSAQPIDSREVRRLIVRLDAERAAYAGGFKRMVDAKNTEIRELVTAREKAEAERERQRDQWVEELRLSSQFANQVLALHKALNVTDQQAAIAEIERLKERQSDLLPYVVHVGASGHPLGRTRHCGAGVEGPCDCGLAELIAARGQEDGK